MKRTMWFCGVLAGVLLVAGAQGATVNVTFLGSGYTHLIEFERVDDIVTLKEAGQLRISIDGFVTTAYCVDTFTPAGTGLMTIVPVTTLNRYNEISWLYDNFAGIVNSDFLGAALGVCIWECLYELPENQLSLSNGFYSIFNLLDEPDMDTITSLANLMLASLAHMPAGYTSHQELVVLRSEDGLQDLLVVIPEPLTMTLLAAGGLALLRRRR
jgi:hypothetical protein